MEVKIKETVNNILKTLECPICLDVLDDPVSTNCHHHFCRNCISTAINQNNVMNKSSCPLCKKKISKRGLKENSLLNGILLPAKEILGGIKLDSGIEVSPPKWNNFYHNNSKEAQSNSMEVFKLMHPSPDKPGSSNIRGPLSKEKVPPTNKIRTKSFTKTVFYTDLDSSISNASGVRISNTNIKSGFPVIDKKKTIPQPNEMNKQMSFLTPIEKQTSSLTGKENKSNSSSPLLKQDFIISKPTTVATVVKKHDAISKTNNLDTSISKTSLIFDNLRDEEHPNPIFSSTKTYSRNKMVKDTSNHFDEINSTDKVNQWLQNSNLLINEEPDEFGAMIQNKINAKKIFKSKETTYQQNGNQTSHHLDNSEDPYLFISSQKTPPKQVKKGRGRRKVIKKGLSKINIEKPTILNDFNNPSTSKRSDVPVVDLVDSDDAFLLKKPTPSKEESKRDLIAMKAPTSTLKQFATQALDDKDTQDEIDDIVLFVTPACDITDYCNKNGTFENIDENDVKKKRPKPYDRRSSSKKKVSKNADLPSTQEQINTLNEKISAAENYELQIECINKTMNVSSLVANSPNSSSKFFKETSTDKLKASPRKPLGQANRLNDKYVHANVLAKPQVSLSKVDDDKQYIVNLITPDRQKCLKAVVKMAKIVMPNGISKLVNAIEDAEAPLPSVTQNVWSIEKAAEKDNDGSEPSTTDDVLAKDNFTVDESNKVDTSIESTDKAAENSKLQIDGMNKTMNVSSFVANSPNSNSKFLKETNILKDSPRKPLGQANRFNEGDKYVNANVLAKPQASLSKVGDNKQYLANLINPDRQKCFKAVENVSKSVMPNVISTEDAKASLPLVTQNVWSTDKAAEKEDKEGCETSAIDEIPAKDNFSVDESNEMDTSFGYKKLPSSEVPLLVPPLLTRNVWSTEKINNNEGETSTSDEVPVKDNFSVDESNKIDTSFEYKKLPSSVIPLLVPPLLTRNVWSTEKINNNDGETSTTDEVPVKDNFSVDEPNKVYTSLESRKLPTSEVPLLVPPLLTRNVWSTDKAVEDNNNVEVQLDVENVPEVLKPIYIDTSCNVSSLSKEEMDIDNESLIVCQKSDSSSTNASNSQISKATNSKENSTAQTNNSFSLEEEMVQFSIPAKLLRKKFESNSLKAKLISHKCSSCLHNFNLDFQTSIRFNPDANSFEINTSSLSFQHAPSFVESSNQTETISKMFDDLEVQTDFQYFNKSIGVSTTEIRSSEYGAQTIISNVTEKLFVDSSVQTDLQFLNPEPSNIGVELIMADEQIKVASEDDLNWQSFPENLSPMLSKEEKSQSEKIFENTICADKIIKSQNDVNLNNTTYDNEERSILKDMEGFSQTSSFSSVNALSGNRISTTHEDSPIPCRIPVDVLKSKPWLARFFSQGAYEDSLEMDTENFENEPFLISHKSPINTEKSDLINTEKSNPINFEDKPVTSNLQEEPFHDDEDDDKNEITDTEEMNMQDWKFDLDNSQVFKEVDPSDGKNQDVNTENFIPETEGLSGNEEDDDILGISKLIKCNSPLNCDVVDNKVNKIIKEKEESPNVARRTSRLSRKKQGDQSILGSSVSSKSDESYVQVQKYSPKFSTDVIPELNDYNSSNSQSDSDSLVHEMVQTSDDRLAKLLKNNYSVEEDDPNMRAAEFSVAPLQYIVQSSNTHKRRKLLDPKTCSLKRRSSSSSVNSSNSKLRYEASSSNKSSPMHVEKKSIKRKFRRIKSIIDSDSSPEKMVMNSVKAINDEILEPDSPFNNLEDSVGNFKCQDSDSEIPYVIITTTDTETNGTQGSAMARILANIEADINVIPRVKISSDEDATDNKLTMTETSFVDTKASEEKTEMEIEAIKMKIAAIENKINNPSSPNLGKTYGMKTPEKNPGLNESAFETPKSDLSGYISDDLFTGSSPLAPSQE